MDYGNGEYRGTAEQQTDREFEREAESEAIEFVNKLNELSQTFEDLCHERHVEGQEKYGKFTFLGNDVVRMMLEELADTANYCRYQAIKLLLIQEGLEKMLSETGLVEDGDEEITIGIQSFKGTKDVGWKR